MMQRNERDSVPMAVLRLLWDNAMQDGGQSWEALYEAVRVTLLGCIRTGQRFAPGDFTLMATNFCGMHWLGGDGRGQTFYDAAVEAGNVSFQESFRQRTSW